MCRFYAGQNFFSESAEFDAFVTSLQTPLAASFRITGSRGSATEFLRMIEERYLGKLKPMEIDGRVLEPPRPLAWYPDRLAWHMDQNRSLLRKVPQFQKLHKFLVAMNEKGYLSRQEAVSMIPPLLLDVQPGQKVIKSCPLVGRCSKQHRHTGSAHTRTHMNAPVAINTATGRRVFACLRPLHRPETCLTQAGTICRCLIYAPRRAQRPASASSCSTLTARRSRPGS